MSAQSQGDSDLHQAVSRNSSSPLMLHGVAKTAAHQQSPIATTPSVPNTTNEHVRNIIADQTVSMDSDYPLRHKDTVEDPLRTKSRGQTHPVPSASRNSVEMRDRSIPPGPAHTASAQGPNNHRAQLAFVTNSARFTRQDLQAKLDQLKELLPANTSADNAPTFSNPSFRRQDSQSFHRLTSIQAQTLVQAQQILDKHVATLSRYNEIKDTAMEMLGILAEQKGMTMKEIMAERDVDEAD